MHAVGLQRLLTPHALTVTLLRLSEPARHYRLATHGAATLRLCTPPLLTHPRRRASAPCSLLSNRARATANRCVSLGIRFHSGICCCRASLALRRTRVRVRVFVWLATPSPPLHPRKQNNECLMMTSERVGNRAGLEQFVGGLAQLPCALYAQLVTFVF